MLFVLTGNGKGKTTSAIGMSIRMLGSGNKVCFIQFIKGMEYSEINALKNYGEDIQTFVMGRKCFIKEDPEDKDYEKAEQAWKLFLDKVQEGFNFIVLDELNIALFFKLLDLDMVIETLSRLSKEIDIVVTGRYAPSQMIDIADMVTEMNEIKHHYYSGVSARKGIEY